MCAYDIHAVRTTFQELAEALDRLSQWVDFVPMLGFDPMTNTSGKAKNAGHSTETSGDNDGDLGVYKAFAHAIDLAKMAHDNSTRKELEKRLDELSKPLERDESEWHRRSEQLTMCRAYVIARLNEIVKANGIPQADTLGEIKEDVASIKKQNDRIEADVEHIQTFAKTAVVKLDGNTALVKDLAEELATWREWVQELATRNKGNTPAPKLCASIQQKIVNLWETFNSGTADCEVSSEASGFRRCKRTYKECLIEHGDDDVWHGRKLKELIPDAKSFERVIHNANEKRRQKREKQKQAKPTAASAPQARRKK